MTDIKCTRCVYKSSSSVTQGGVPAVGEGKEGQYAPMLSPVTIEFWIHPPSLLMIVDNFDLEKNKFSRMYFQQGSQGAPWLIGYAEIFTGEYYSELEFSELTKAEYLPRRLEQLKAAYNKKYSIQPVPKKKRILKKKRSRK